MTVTTELVSYEDALASYDPVMGLELARHPNVRVTEATHGPGVYEAVVTTLAERR